MCEVALLKRVCSKSIKSWGPSGAVQNKTPAETFKLISTNLINLNQFLKEQREFERDNCKHILCGDTRNSMIVVGLALRLLKPSVVYEIGRYRGWSTTQIAFNLKKNNTESKFISIDPHKGAKGGDGWKEDQCGGSTEWEMSKDNILKAGVANFATLVKAYSQEYINEVDDKIEFIFIDGDHTYEGAKRDVEQYGEKMTSGALCFLHDVWGENFAGTNYGPCRVYAEADPEKWEKIGHVWDVGILRRK